MSTILASSGVIPLAGSLLSTVLVATVCSVLTATLPDADLVALKPTPIIKGTAKKRYSKKYKREYYYITVSENDFRSKYKNKFKNDDAKIEPGGKGVYIYYDKCGTKNFAMKEMALIFKSMGIQKHRGWQSHSPVLWIPLWLLLIWVFYRITDIGAYIGAIVLGLGLGWISHILGDLFTLDGIPLMPKFWEPKKSNGTRDDIKIAPLAGIKVGGHRLFRFSFAKASNRIWIGIVCFIFINIFLKILAPNLFDIIWTGDNSIFAGILHVISAVFSCLISAILKLLGYRR